MVLVTGDNNKLQTTIYRKPTHTDWLLDQSSYNPTSHKATTIRTLTRRAQLVCNSPDSLQDESDYLNNVFSKNNYNTDFVRRNTHSNTDSNTVTNFNSGPVTTATIPYIRGTSETIARILQPSFVLSCSFTLNWWKDDDNDYDEPYIGGGRGGGGGRWGAEAPSPTFFMGSILLTCKDPSIIKIPKIKG